MSDNFPQLEVCLVMNALAQDFRFALRTLLEDSGLHRHRPARAGARHRSELGHLHGGEFGVCSTPCRFRTPERICQIYTERFRTVHRDGRPHLRGIRETERHASNMSRRSAEDPPALPESASRFRFMARSVTTGILADLGRERVARPHLSGAGRPGQRRGAQRQAVAQPFQRRSDRFSAKWSSWTARRTPSSA